MLSVALFSIIFSAALVAAEPCFGEGCVTFYSDSNCQDFINDSSPTCAGNCFQFSSFNSLSVQGDDYQGTDCKVYSDYYCQDEIVDSEPVIDGEICMSTPGAQSMICYFGC
ncbi:hypothetical protein B0H11DRAFT_1714054 [Mycena galericulata]|nr:hypothetical protein B0H11DRAFT_1714054 [Mycena galericulata]